MFRAKPSPKGGGKLVLDIDIAEVGDLLIRRDTHLLAAIMLYVVLS